MGRRETFPAGVFWSGAAARLIGGMAAALSLCGFSEADG